MSSYMPPNFNQGPQTPISCTRCGKVFYTDNNLFLMTCSGCHQRDVDYTVRLGNQARIFQIDITIMKITIEFNNPNVSDDRKDVLERLVAQLEQEKTVLSQ
jgi:predicted  nucleic acid-binding Zn-ribbon protein